VTNAMTEYCECPGRAAYYENIVSAALAFKDYNALRGCAILITGATGLIGGSAVRALLYLNRVHNLGLTLLCPVRNIEKAKQALSGIYSRRELNVFEADICDMPEITGPVDYIIHAASPTASKYFIERPVETINAVVRGTMNMLELAREKNVRGMVYLSSMEAFGQVTDERPRAEGELGSIDLSSARSSYSEGKRLCELMCACYAKEYGVPVRTARLAQTFGAGVSADDNRVFMQFIKAALRGEGPVLHTRGLSLGNYVHISDCVSAILTLLTRGAIGESYNTSGDDCCASIFSLAERVCEALTDGVRPVIDIPENAEKLGYAPDTKLIMDSSRLKALGWQPRFSLDDMINSLARDIAEQNGRHA